MHVYYIMIKSSQKFWVVYVRYRFIPEQCAYHVKFLLKQSEFMAYQIQTQSQEIFSHLEAKPIL